MRYYRFPRYSDAAKVTAEIDGQSHDGKVEYDQQRDAYLESLGLRVVHIRAVDVLQNMEGVLRFLTTLALRATPPLEGNKNPRPDGPENSPPTEGWQAEPDGVVYPPLEGNKNPRPDGPDKKSGEDTLSPVIPAKAGIQAREAGHLFYRFTLIPAIIRATAEKPCRPKSRAVDGSL